MWKTIGKAAYNFGKGVEDAKTKDLAKKVAKELKKDGKSSKKGKSVSDEDFKEILKYIEDQTFSSDKIKAAIRMGSQNALSVSQIKSLMKYGSFDDDKIKIANAAFDKCTNKAVFFKLESALTFSSSKSKLRIQ